MQPKNTLCPSSQAQPTNLFQNANTIFGTPPSTQSGFGRSKLFGQQQIQSSGHFSTSSEFGQQKKPAGFGFATTEQPSLFGKQNQKPQSSGLSQSSASNLFGSPAGGKQRTGPVVKFNPVTDTDTIVMNTKYLSITCMKEYEGKSFEELRCEYYAANRKGGFGANTSTAPAFTAGVFGATPQNANPFVGSVTAKPFRSTSTPILGTNTNRTQSIFGTGQQNAQKDSSNQNINPSQTDVILQDNLYLLHQEKHRHDVSADVTPLLKNHLKIQSHEDEFDLFGKTIAVKLRALEKHQGLSAQKIISEVISRAEMGKLNFEDYESYQHASGHSVCGTLHKNSSNLNSNHDSSTDNVLLLQLKSDPDSDDNTSSVFDWFESG